MFLENLEPMNSSTSSFRSLAIKTMAWAIVLITILWIIRALVYQGIRSHEVGEYDKMNQLFVDTIHSNTLLLGSSRCESHLIPGIIDSITGLSSYNAGLGGADLPVNALTLRSILSRSNHIQQVVLSIDIHNMNGKNDVNSLYRFLPYLGDPSLYKGLSKLDGRVRYMKLFPFYSFPFTGDKMLYTSYRGYADRTTAFDLTYRDGFVPVPVVKNGGFMLDVSKPFYSNPTQKDQEALQEIIELCKQKNIVLVIIIAPLHKNTGDFFMNKNEMLRLLEDQLENSSFKILNYMDGPLSDSSQFFLDGNHLNTEGAMLFSAQLAHDLQPIFGK